MNTTHDLAIHTDAMLEDLAHQSTEYLTDLRLNIHAYTGPDTSGLNSVFAQRLDQILADRS